MKLQVNGMKMNFRRNCAGVAVVLLLVASGVNGQLDPSGVKLINGRKYSIHKVTSKETWTSLSKEYKTSTQALMSANPGVMDLKTGQVINVPLTLEEVRAEKSGPKTENEPNKQITLASEDNLQVGSKYHEVKAGETLYGIAKKYGVKPSEIRSWNKMEKDQVNLGQKLIIGAPTPDRSNELEVKKDKIKSPEEKRNSNPVITEEKQQPVSIKKTAPDNKSDSKPEPVKETSQMGKPNEENKTNQEEKNIALASTDPKSIPVVKKENTNESANRSETVLKKSSSGKSLVQVTENGVASYIMDGELNQNKYYGLHRSAPPGTIMKVTNRMNNQYVFVKIVGLLPDTGDNDNQIIKISQAAAKRIGVLDQKFQVELSYGVMQ